MITHCQDQMREDEKYMKINLHTHSSYSLDGEFDVKYLIKKFKDNNFDVISITDHDTCEAYKHIEDNCNINIITGIEADAIVNNHTYDFLCYDFALDEVYNYAKKKYGSVDERQNKIFNALVQKANDNNITLSNIDTYDSKNEYAHAAIFRMLDEVFLEKYNIKSTSDLYRKSTIDSSFPLYIDMHIVWPDIKELLEIIHNNKGKVFIAHPYRYNRNVTEVLEEVKDYVDGIEICNNPNSKEEVEFLYNYAKNNNLLVSCGSDYHGNNRYSLECEYLNENMINDILSWIVVGPNE